MMNKGTLIVAVDFDGTVVSHKYPEVGPDLPGAVDCLKKMVAAGHKLILWTMRSGEHLEAAVQWYKDRGIPLWGVNTNPGQHHWSQSPKAYAHLYIDDAALGAPTFDDPESGRSSLDWAVVAQADIFNETTLEDIIVK